MAPIIPASIRYKNPGAMWGGNPVSRRWGEMDNIKLNDGLHQNNHIAVFPDYVHGIAAQIDLWRSPRYRNKPFNAAIAIWSGGNWVQSYIDFVLKRVPGMKANQIMDDAFLDSPTGLEFLKAQAWHEAGVKYPAPDSDFAAAQKLVFGGVPVTTPAVKKIVVATSSGTGTAVAAKTAFALSLPWAIVIGLGIAVVVFIVWKLKQTHAPAVTAPTPAPDMTPAHDSSPTPKDDPK